MTRGVSLYELVSQCARLCALGIIVLAGCNGQVDLGPVADAATADSIRAALTTSGGSAEAEETASTGTGWATLRGQFVYGGDAPPPPDPYNVTKEHNICTVNGQPPLQETLIVDEASKGIKNVAIYLWDASRVHESAAPKTGAVDFDQKACVFLTHVVGVTVGQSLQIKNSDPTGHNTNIVGGGFNQLIPEGGAIPFAVRKKTAMPAQVVCSIHPWMVAYMLARDNGYFAVTDAEGRFEIANVPAGEELEFQVWHEIGAANRGLVGETPDADDLKWSKRGRVTVTLQPDEVKEIQVIVPPGSFRG
jgi:hypothetical protein